MLSGISASRRAQKKLRVHVLLRKVMRETSQDHGDVRAEITSIFVNFVNNDPFQTIEELMPLIGVSQKTVMEHVRVGDKNIRWVFSEQLTILPIRVSVIPPRVDLPTLDVVHKIIKLISLIECQRLGRIEHERATFGFVKKSFNHRYLESKRFSAGRGCLQNDIFSAQGFQDRLCLMLVETVDTAFVQGIGQR